MLSLEAMVLSTIEILMVTHSPSSAVLLSQLLRIPLLLLLALFVAAISVAAAATFSTVVMTAIFVTRTVDIYDGSECFRTCHCYCHRFGKSP